VLPLIAQTTQLPKLNLLRVADAYLAVVAVNGGRDTSSCADTQDATCRREIAHIEKELIRFYHLYGILNDLIR
jgi:hypothetical protein